ncbi:MAG: MlaC/ttg2D family ABC transporter substrate-binding protein [Candidatus Binatia bacterium]
MNYYPTHKRLLLFLLTASFLFVALPLSAGAPSDQTRATIEKVLAILTDSSVKSERLDRLRQTIRPSFDFAEMAKRSLGSHWQRRTPAEQQEFIKLFTDLVESSYVDAIESYNGEKVVVGNEKQDKDFAEVNTKIVTKKGEEFAIDYKLHQSSGGWKIYDAVIENVSLVNNYRSQFNRVIGKSSYQDLVSKMKDKQFEAPGKKAKT